MVTIPKISGNLLLGVGGVIAAVFLVSQIRKAGADITGALPVVDEGLRQSITDIASSVAKTTSQFTDLAAGVGQFQQDVATNLGQFQQDVATNLGQFQQDTATNLESITNFFGNLFKTSTIPSTISPDPTQQTSEQQEEIFGKVLTEEEEQTILDIDKALTEGTPLPDTGFASLLKKFNPPGIFGFGFLGTDKQGITESLAKELGIFEFTTADISQQQIFELSKIGKGIQDVETIFKLFPTREDILFSQAFDVDRPIELSTTSAPTPTVVTPTPTVVSELPIEQEFQAFVTEGSQAAQFTIFENPIDTLSEAIALGLTASQAADFLAATEGKITPSQIASGEIDPDIKNIVAGFFGGGIGQAVPVSATPLETLSIRERENIKAAQFTCEQFGLNCELAGSIMA